MTWKLFSIQLRNLFAMLILCSSANMAIAQTPIPVGPQMATFTSMVRGYHFTSPVNFTICGLYIPTDASAGLQSVEVVKFTNAAPPAFPGTTNAFTSQFYQASWPTNAMIPCSIPISTGDIVGVYGARAANMVNSYDGINFVSNISGSNATFSRSGMQANLSTGQMANIWSEVNFRIGRIIMYYQCCPTPPAPQGPISGDTTLCIGDTVTFSIPYDTIAVSYTWTVPAGDTVISGVNDTVMTMVVGPNSTGGQICVSLTDTCTTSPTICVNYTINQLAAPPAITGPTSICQFDSAWYTVPAAPGISSYTWTLPAGTSFLSPQDSSAIHVQFGGGGGEICVQATDSCATSDTTCLTIGVNLNPTLANAGPDRTVCAGNMANLAATAATTGVGVWTVVSAPGPGTFTDSTDHQSGYSSISPGQHILRWTVESAGCPTTSDIMNVDIIATPQADFTTANVCEGTPVSFQDQSSSNGSSITAWLWDVTGNGVDNYSNQNPTHNYNAPGIYNVRLIVSAQGCADTLFQNLAVNPMLVLIVTAEDRCLQEVVEIDNASTISLGSIDSVSWNFGDGSAIVTSQGANIELEPTHNYLAPGQYTINHTAYSNAGCVANTVIPVEVFHLPVADFTALNACQFQTTEFFDQSTVTGANIDTWKWSFGVGNDSAFTEDAAHDYVTNGFVDVTLLVRSDEGCVDEKTSTLEVFPTPVNEFNYSNKVCLGDTHFLDDQSTIAYGSIDQFFWTIEDSIDYTGANVWHLFDEVGLYNVSLTTESDNGCRATIEKEIPVFAIPEADFVFTNECEDQLITFMDSTKFAGAILSYKWDFGDSTAIATEQNPQHAFETYGVYDVTLEVESYKGCIGTITYPVKVFEKVIPNFYPVPDSGCSPLSVKFVDSTQSFTDRDLTYKWHYGDGTSRFDTAEYTYVNSSGRLRVYDVTLEILTDEGCIGSTTLDSSITVIPQPLAAFSSDPALESLKTTNPLVQFKNQSIQFNWLWWNFGDGETSRDHNPAHEYKFEGEYEVMLVAKNVYQCADTISKLAVVNHANIPFIPSAFTPNGDGINDVFFIEGLQDVSEVILEIYDRWGHIIYKAEGLDAQWDGKNSQSRLVQQGVYNYRLLYTDSFGERFEISGNLSVIGVEN